MENPYAIVPLLRGRWARLAAATVMGLALSGCLDDSQGDDNTPPPGNDDNDTTNEAPVADAGMDIQALVDESVQFDASGSQDPDGEIVDYSWSNSLTGETPSTSYDTADSYSVTLTVTDDAGATAQDTVTVVIEEDDGNNDDDQNNDDDNNEVEPYDGISLYLKQPEAWSEAYIHYWGVAPEGDHPDTDWPGEAMEDVGDGWYRVTFDGAELVNLVFNDNAGTQTGDHTRSQSGCFENDTWSRTCDPMSEAEALDDDGTNNDDQSPAAEHVAFVHLFEWSWDDIAQECEQHLGPKGFTGVQVSPPQEHITGDNWWTRYQPVSYQLDSRSGDRAAFIDMVDRCNAEGVAIYADLVINHTAAGSGGTGTGGTSWSYMDHPMYSQQDYHSACEVDDYQDAHNVQNCQLVGLPDLDTGSDSVQQTIADYANDLIDLGVAGFRIDAAKHMHPDDLQGIQAKLDGEPYVYSEVIDLGGEAVTADQYLHLGAVEEFKYGRDLGGIFMNGGLNSLDGFGENWGFIPGDQAVAFVDNHDNQRGHGGGGNIVTHKDSSLYDLANVFMLAHPYGHPRLMSSFAFSDSEAGPPGTSVHQGDSLNCFGSDWVCEHRWRPIANMVAFRATTHGEGITNWWDNGNNQIAFSRGGKGFVVINRENSELNERLQTGLPAGVYCNVIAAEPDDCADHTITVDTEGFADFMVGNMASAAIHVDATMD